MGASGCGKTTIGKQLEEIYGVKQLVSYTSRKKRDGEVEGKDYYFVDRVTAKNYGVLSVESVEYDGSIYGLTRSEVSKKTSNGKDVYFICDRIGAKEIKRAFKDDVVIFWFKISPLTMFKRMRSRGDSIKSATKRIIHAFKNNEFERPNGSYMLNANREIDSYVVYSTMLMEKHADQFQTKGEKK